MVWDEYTLTTLEQRYPVIVPNAWIEYVRAALAESLPPPPPDAPGKASKKRPADSDLVMIDLAEGDHVSGIAGATVYQRIRAENEEEPFARTLLLNATQIMSLMDSEMLHDLSIKPAHVIFTGNHYKV